MRALPDKKMVVNTNGQVAGDPPFGPELLEPTSDDNIYGDTMTPSTPTTFRHCHIHINGVSTQSNYIDAQNLANALNYPQPALWSTIAT